MSRRPVVLCILDGWGLNPDTANNAPALAKTPTMDALMAGCPNATLLTHGRDVGLPEGQMGNSEVGHTNIGAGRVVKMDLVQIDEALEDSSFETRDALVTFIDTLKASGGTAHLMGLVSDGGVHSQFEHLEAAMKIISQAGVPVVIHAICDGRDDAPKSDAAFIDHLQQVRGPNVRIGTVLGRYFAMDRDNRWERVQKAYDAMVQGDGARLDTVDARDVVYRAYEAGETDEFITPTCVADYAGMADGDGIFMLNYRADRAREILAAIGDPDFDAFDVTGRPTLAAKLGMVDYSKAHDAYMTTLFPKQEILNTLGAWVAAKGLKQFRRAETENYPHVTFFLNGGVEVPETGEDRAMPKSPAVATYDMQPEMSAGEVTEHLITAIRGDYDLIVVNYANPDMVGHTGELQAAIAACEAVDSGLGQSVEALRDVGGAMIVCADHGNCEVMVDPETGGPHTAHTTNPVPVILVGGPDNATLRDGRLADLAPSLLELMGIEKPAEMTGETLIQ